MPWASKKSAGDCSDQVMAEAGATEGKAKFVVDEIGGKPLFYPSFQNGGIGVSTIPMQFVSISNVGRPS